EAISFDDLGGSVTHTTKSGVADLGFPSEADLIQGAKQLLAYLPSNNLDDPPRTEPLAPAGDAAQIRAKLKALVPENANQPYDMQAVVELIVDQGSFFPIKPEFAPQMVTGFARLGG